MCDSFLDFDHCLLQKRCFKLPCNFIWYTYTYTTPLPNISEVFIMWLTWIQQHELGYLQYILCWNSMSCDITITIGLQYDVCGAICQLAWSIWPSMFDLTGIQVQQQWGIIRVQYITFMLTLEWNFSKCNIEGQITHASWQIAPQTSYCNPIVIVLCYFSRKHSIMQIAQLMLLYLVIPQEPHYENYKILAGGEYLLEVWCVLYNYGEVWNSFFWAGNDQSLRMSHTRRLKK